MRTIAIIRNKLCLLTAALMLPVLFSLPAQAQKSAEPALAGKGLGQHPFLYCGEWQNQSLNQQTMYLVREGKVVWSYTNPKVGELGDYTRLS